VRSSSPNIIRMTKSRRMEWKSHVGRDHSEDLGVDGRVPNVKRILSRVGRWIRFMCLRIGIGGALL
jgi:hypothetical protein